MAPCGLYVCDCGRPRGQQADSSLSVSLCMLPQEKKAASGCRARGVMYACTGMHDEAVLQYRYWSCAGCRRLPVVHGGTVYLSSMSGGGCCVQGKREARRGTGRGRGHRCRCTAGGELREAPLEGGALGWRWAAASLAWHGIMASWLLQCGSVPCRMHAAAKPPRRFPGDRYGDCRTLAAQQVMGAPLIPPALCPPVSVRLRCLICRAGKAYLEMSGKDLVGLSNSVRLGFRTSSRLGL